MRRVHGLLFADAAAGAYRADDCGTLPDIHDAMPASRFHRGPRCQSTQHHAFWSDQGHAMALAKFLEREFDPESWYATLAERHSY